MTARKFRIDRNTASAGLAARAVMLGMLPLWLGACTPTVKLDTSKPITINLNVNIRHEILVKVDKDLDKAMSKNNGLF